MKRTIRLLSGLSLIAVMAALAIFATPDTTTANTIDLGSLPPNHPSAINLYCEDPTVTAWYQVQKHDKSKNDELQFVGSTVACSGWDAIRQFALVHGYSSTHAASNDGVVAGNRGATWLGTLSSLTAYTP